ncbi:ScnB [Streptosporangium amethystogenes]|uniref:ScnB n=1 Tax=Streptosporangium amethystogenes TaxID=2002 RepID=UPI00361F3295
MSAAPTTYDVLMDTLSDIGERTDAGMGCLEHEPAVWESRMQATCEALSSQGVLDNLERRLAEDRLGESVYARFPVQTRSTLVVTHLLMDQKVFTEKELRKRIEVVRERFAEE